MAPCCAPRKRRSSRSIGTTGRCGCRGRRLRSWNRWWSRMADRRAIVLGLVVLLGARALAAQESGTAADLAQLLALEDRKTFDGPALQRAAQHPDSLVRRYAALVMGRIG